MAVNLEAATEERIERGIARGPYREPDELINRALDLLDSQEEWLFANKEAIGELLEERFSECQREDFVTPEEARAMHTRSREERMRRAQ